MRKRYSRSRKRDRYTTSSRDGTLLVGAQARRSAKADRYRTPLAVRPLREAW